MFCVMLLGYPQAVGFHLVPTSTHPIGVAAPAHTSMIDPIGRLSNLVMVHTLYTMTAGCPHFVGSQWSFVLIQPAGTGLPAQTSFIFRIESVHTLGGNSRCCRSGSCL